MNIPCPHCGATVSVWHTDHTFSIEARTCCCVLSGEDVRWIVSQARARTPYRVSSWVVRVLTRLEEEWKQKGIHI